MPQRTHDRDTVPPTHWRSVLRRVADLGLASGSIYDALHMYCALKVGADQVLTYNVRHFERFQLPGVVVTTP